MEEWRRVDEPMPVNKASLSLAELLHAMTVAVAFLQRTIENPQFHHVECFQAAQELARIAQVYSTILQRHDTEVELRQMQSMMAQIKREQGLD